jgi:hypothetical protein
MRELADSDFPDAERIRIVLDNPSTHHPGSLYQAFPPGEARQGLRRLEFHYVPKHASWLNMVEIEIGVLRVERLDRRIATREQLDTKIAAWQRQRQRIRSSDQMDVSQPQRRAPKWDTPIRSSSPFPSP